MRALLTGGSGFVGCHVAQILGERGVSTRALVRKNSRRDNLINLDPRLLEFFEGDLNDAKSLREAIRGCDILYHVAADYRLWAKDPQELYRSNVQGTRDLLQAALEEGVPLHLEHLAYPGGPVLQIGRASCRERVSPRV